MIPLRAIVGALVLLPIAAPTTAEDLNCIVETAGKLVRAPENSFTHRRPAGPAAHQGLHGQLLFGADAVCLHHLPFLLDDPDAHPHIFQTLVRVAFASPDDRAAYLERRKAAPEALFTAAPPPFDQDALEAMRDGGTEGRSLGRVEIYDGHFENDPRPSPFLVAEMTVEEVIVFREIDPGGPRRERLSYVVAAAGSEAFLVHLFAAPPDFDQVLRAGLAVEPPAHGPPPDLHGGRLTVHETPNAEGARLRPGTTLDCGVDDGTRRLPTSVAIEVTTQIYCEGGELSAMASDAAFEGRRACSTE